MGGGQGPLSLTCRCEVNKLSHGVVPVTVPVVIVDAVVRWWWWWHRWSSSLLLHVSCCEEGEGEGGGAKAHCRRLVVAR